MDFPEFIKINGVYKRYEDGPTKGRFIDGEWAQPEFGYLQYCPWDLYEKIDGTNTRIGIQLVEEGGGARFVSSHIGGRTDRAQMTEGLHKALEIVARRAEDWALDWDTPGEMILYGEGYGAGIQKGGAYRPDKGFILFDVRVANWWLERENVVAIAKQLGLDVVAHVGTTTLNTAITMIAANRYPSAFPGVQTEGVVAHPQVPLRTRSGDRIITKIKVKDFQ